MLVPRRIVHTLRMADRLFFQLTGQGPIESLFGGHSVQLVQLDPAG